MYEYKAIVKRIIDGDTIVFDIDLGFSAWIHDEHFRLAGIDTPELKSKVKEEKEFAKKAKLRLEELCPVGSIQKISVSKGKEKYGRYLVVIHQENNIITINRTLINEGLAKPYYE